MAKNKKKSKPSVREFTPPRKKGDTKVVLTEEEAYTACELRNQGNSVANTSHIMGQPSSSIAAATRRIVLHMTAKEAAAAEELISRDAESGDLTEFTLRAWHQRIEKNGLKKKKSRRNDDYRQDFQREFELIYRS